MSEHRNVIEMCGFSFRYQGSEAESLRDISLTVKQGEFLVLTGVSGCGKTTLTRCFNGLIPDFFEGKLGGSCRVHGMDIAAHETSDYAAHVGSVFQDPRSQFFTLHVNTEIPFPGENLAMPMPKLQKSYQNTVEELALAPLLGKSIFQLSSGEKQKVAIASVKTAGVSTYVLDEPSANLDSAGTEQLRQVLAALKAQGHTIIISEHKLHYLKELADRVLVLSHGGIVHTLSGTEFRAASSQWLCENGLRQISLEGIKPPILTTTFSSEVSLRADSLAFCYPDSQTLWEKASFECRGGEVIGVVGKNGVGKSTLIRVLMGLEKPKSGKVYLNGKYAPRQQRKKQSFYVMQDVDYQFFAGTVLDELLSGNLKNDTAIYRAKDLLSEFGLASFADVHPSRLSGGQKQRLSIALALMSETAFVYLDEPTSGLDALNMKKVQQAVRQLAQAGRCVFVITHDYEFAAGVFTSLLVLRDNTITHIDTAAYGSDELSHYFEN